MLVQERDFVVLAPRIHGLAGEWWLSPDFQLRQLPAHRITARTASVRAEDGTVYPARGSPSPWQRRSLWDWNFGEGHPAPGVLGRTCAFELVFDSEDGHPDTVRVTYRRTM